MSMIDHVRHIPQHLWCCAFDRKATSFSLDILRPYFCWERMLLFKCGNMLQRPNHWPTRNSLSTLENHSSSLRISFFFPLSWYKRSTLCLYCCIACRTSVYLHPLRLGQCIRKRRRRCYQRLPRRSLHFKKKWWRGEISIFPPLLLPIYTL